MQIRRSESILSFKNYLLKISQPTAKLTSNIHSPIGLKFLTSLRLGLSHLNEHKLKHNFQDCVNPCAHAVWKLNLFPISFCSVIVQPS